MTSSSDDVELMVGASVSTADRDSPGDNDAKGKVSLTVGSPLFVSDGVTDGTMLMIVSPLFVSDGATDGAILVGSPLLV